ncbi:MAG: hypothetical protein MUO60_12720, partial [Clostridiaceae bacterium]|nr:hypothetical protein [Clostridiaceae bacterium]
ENSNDFTTGNKKPELKQEELKMEIVESEVQFQYTDKDTEGAENKIIETSEPIHSIVDNETEKENVLISLKSDLKIDACNLCHDVLCTRKRGQHKSLCMHYKENTQVTEGDVKYDIK